MRGATHSRMVRALASFGLSAGAVARERAALERSCGAMASRLVGRLVAAREPTMMVVGPSGSGKSTLLGALEREAMAQGHLVVPVEGERADVEGAWRSRPIVLIPETTLPEALGLLARVGLAEARLLGLTPSQLSCGERARFRLALALRAAFEATDHAGVAWVLCDEFGSGLDHETAAGVAASAARIARARPGLHVVACTCDERLVGAIAPDVVVRTRMGRGPRVDRGHGDRGRVPRGPDRNGRRAA